MWDVRAHKRSKQLAVVAHPKVQQLVYDYSILKSFRPR